MRVKLHSPKAQLKELTPRENGIRVFEASLHAKPEKGEANRALIALVASYFKIAPGRVRIVSGVTARRKIVEL